MDVGANACDKRTGLAELYFAGYPVYGNGSFVVAGAIAKVEEGCKIVAGDANGSFINPAAYKGFVQGGYYLTRPASQFFATFVFASGTAGGVPLIIAGEAGCAQAGYLCLGVFGIPFNVIAIGFGEFAVEHQTGKNQYGAGAVVFDDMASFHFYTVDVVAIKFGSGLCAGHYQRFGVHGNYFSFAQLAIAAQASGTIVDGYGFGEYAGIAGRYGNGKTAVAIGRVGADVGVQIGLAGQFGIGAAKEVNGAQTYLCIYASNLIAYIAIGYFGFGIVFGSGKAGFSFGVYKGVIVERFLATGKQGRAKEDCSQGQQ